MPFHPTYATASHWLHALDSGEISAIEALRYHQARHASHNAAVNAIVATCWDTAFARAEAADAAFAKGERLGALHGLPMTIKEGFDVAGMFTTVGDPALEGNLAARNSVAVQQLLDAGAVIFGKTNVPLHMADLQCNNKVYGRTQNPWDVSRTSGGSSGGAAAALAADLSPLELGSDLAGSIRTPAHFCGVYGLRPTFDLVPVRGHFMGTRRFSAIDMTVAGPMARSAADLRLALSVMKDPKWNLPQPALQPLKHYRVGVWLEDPAVVVDAQVLQPLQALVQQLKQAGCEILPAPKVSLAKIYDLYFRLMAATIAGGLPESVYKKAKLGGLLGKKVQTLYGYAHAMTMSHRDYCHLQEEVAALKAQFQDYFQKADVLLMPVSPTVTPSHVHHKTEFYQRKITVNGKPEPYADQMIWAGVSALLGLPAASAPLPKSLRTQALPVGVQIMGAALQDHRVINFAEALSELGFGFEPPPLS